MSHTIPEPPPAYDSTRIIERPDGYFWLDLRTGREYGPFETLPQAVEDMDYNAESNYEPAETIEEAESELGLADWVDNDTGELAEDTQTRLDDH